LRTVSEDNTIVNPMLRSITNFMKRKLIEQHNVNVDRFHKFKQIALLRNKDQEDDGEENVVCLDMV
jgi:hypothetical protein